LPGGRYGFSGKAYHKLFNCICFLGGPTMANFHPQPHPSTEGLFNQSLQELGHMLATPEDLPSVPVDPSAAVVDDQWHEKLEDAVEDIEAFFQAKQPPSSIR
jgi:hypothetical protein